MAKANWTRDAEADLNRIALFIADHEGRRATAKKIVREIQSECRQRAKSPLMSEDCSHLGRNLRRFTHKRWVVVYRPSDTGIEVVGVVDSARDYSDYFRKR